MAATVRQHRGRIAWYSIGAGGKGGLGKRIDRVLQGLAEETSPARKLLVATTCATAIFVAAACRQPPAPLMEDPAFAADRARLKAKEELVKTAQRMTPDQGAALEAAWRANPADLAALERLLIYYGPEFSGKEGPTDQQKIVARRPLILWLVEQHPEDELARSWMARIFPSRRDPLADPIGYERVKAIWLRHASRPDATVPILSNAAYFFEANDKPLAEQMLLRAQALEPSRPWSQRIGRLYALILVGSDASMPLNVVRSVNPQDASSADAQEVRQKLATTTDARLLASTGESLVRPGSVVTARKDALPFDPVPLGRTYLDRAVQLDPQLRQARALLASLRHRDENERRWQPLRSVPREQWPETIGLLPERDRFVLLSHLADNEYLRAELAHNEKKDETAAAGAWARSKKYAQDALALAPKFRDDPQYGLAIYHANIALATHALREGDKATAVDYMLKASDAPPSDAFLAVSSAAHLRLINYLLKYGERESVAVFLERSARLGVLEPDRMLEDAAAIRAGRMPKSFQLMMSRGE